MNQNIKEGNEMVVSKGNSLRRGFVTIATGHPRYYQMAHNLLQSYRLYGHCSYPFAIICDNICPEAEQFDDIVLLENPTCSFLDKLALYKFAPYDETIFIDADCLIIGDVNNFWEELAPMDDFSCYGCNLPLEARNGWFYYKDMKELQPLIKHGISMHGGVYFIRKSERSRAIFERAIEISKEYDKYVFFNFDTPADEPVLALSMVLLDCDPCPVPVHERIAVIPGLNESRFKFSPRGVLLYDRRNCPASVIHFGSNGVNRFMYRYWMNNVEHRLLDKSFKPSFLCYYFYKIRCIPAEFKHGVKRLVFRKLPKDTQKYLKAHLPQKLVCFLRK